MSKWWKRTFILSLIFLAVCLTGFLFGTLTFGSPISGTVGADMVLTGAQLAGQGKLNGVSAGSDGAGAQVLSLSGPAAPDTGSTGSFISEPLKADFAFNALGLHWRAETPTGSSVDAQVRFSQDGSTWGDWQPVYISELEGPDDIGETASAGETIGDLVFTDRARYFQYRLNLHGGSDGASPAVAKVTASYIDSKGYSQTSFSPAAFIGKVGNLFASDTASADPAIISRSQWGANPAYMGWDPEYVAPKKIIIHHTVTSNNDPDPAATIRSIYYYHAVTLGWGDIGYNYLVDQQGRVYEGRYGGNGVVAGHALGWNYGTVGISVLGNYETAPVSAASYNALVDLSAWISNLNHIDPWGWEPMNGVSLPNYLGHRDVGATACPGANLYARLPQLRNDAHARYNTYPIIDTIRTKYDSLGGAPGAPLNAEYPVYDWQGNNTGKAQDFQYGRIIWNKDTDTSFWVYGGILNKYDSLGREAGALGLPTSDEYGAGSGRANNFQGGTIFWGAGTGAHLVYGAILSRYLAAGGPGALGLPITDEYDPSGTSGWRESDFQAGNIYWSSPSGALVIYGAILNEYLYKGSTLGMGVPLGEESDIPGVPGGRMVSFTGGYILWSATSGAHALLPGPLNDHYQSWGGPAGYLGLPTGDETLTGAGTAQIFKQGIITYYGPLGAHTVYGGIAQQYLNYMGPSGAFGPAASEEHDAPGVFGGRQSDFAGGPILWSADTGAHGVYGGIGACYTSLGGSVALGLPTGEEFDIPGVPGGRQSDFQGGSIYWSASTRAHEVHGGIQSHWYLYGGPSGPLGLPLTDEYETPGVSGGRESDFQGGRIYWSASSGAHLVYGGILGAYLSAGGTASALGLPALEESDIPGVPGGRQSEFTGGSICWSGATGAHEVHGGIYDLWYLNGGPSGPLGLPLTDEYETQGVSGGRESDFQGGRIYWSDSTGSHMVYGGILAAYLDAGGTASALGLPTSEEYEFGLGRRSDFQGGYITWEVASGAQVTLNG